MSNDPAAVTRFWSKSLNLLIKSGVLDGAQAWYVRHAEAYLKASGGRRLATHSAAEVERWLASQGRIGRMQGWRLGQMVEAVRALFVLIASPVASQVDWQYWRDSVKPLADGHPTLARSNGQGAAVGALEAGDAPAPSEGAEISALVRVIRQRGYSIRTEQAYRGWVERFQRFLGERDARAAGAREVRAFLEALAVEGRVAASTQNQALNALVFFYDAVLEQPLGDMGGFARAKRPQRLPLVLSRGEVMRLLKELEGVHGLMGALLYGSGMRLMECVRLRVKDVDFDYRQILVRDGKGRKDRVVPLPEKLLAPLRAHLAKVRALHEEDLALGGGEVFMPDALDRKYPGAAKE